MTDWLNIPMMLSAAGDDGSALRWLLGLREIDPTDPTLVLSWRYALPSWAWVAIITVICAIVGASYRHMLGRRGGRMALAAVRVMILLLIAALLAGPSLVLPNEEIEPDHVLMLVDRSASVSVNDVIDPQDPGRRESRQQQLGRILDTHTPLWQRLAEQHRMDWLGFSDTLTDLGDPQQLDDPRGRATALRTAIHEALRRTAGKPISAMVVMSDGRSSEPLGPDTWRLLRQMGVTVYTVPLGSPRPPMDLAVQRIDAPDRAFVKDAVPIGVTVSRTGDGDGDSQTAPPGTVVRLVDTTTGDVLDEKPVERFDQSVRLITTPTAAGAANWRVELSTPEPELIVENNKQDLELTLVDRPIRLLYVEGYPRWEYRYFKNMVVREESVTCSIMLISADRTFAQEGNVPLRRLPRTEEEMRPYDVIVLGDVPADFFNAEQMQLIEQQVSVRGAGLMWIGGPHDTPASYTSSPLASLLPMGSASSLATLNPPIKMMPTPTAESLGVLRLRSLKPDEDEDATWPADLPSLQWAQSIESLKPAAEVLAVDEASTQPLVVRMRFGAGQTLYVATDETWRWRYGRGELYPEQFWMQIVRLLARGRLQAGAGGDERASLMVSHRRAAVGDTLVVELQIHDQALMQQHPQRIDIEVTEVADTAAGAPRPGGAAAQRLTLVSTEREGRYRALWHPATAGRMALHVVTPELADLNLQQTVTIERADAEMRFPAADHGLLAELAERSGGAVVEPEQVGQLDHMLPNNARRTVTDISEPLWNSPLAFGLVLILLAAEWIGRRLIGLA
ncbi:hypothetical protein HED60_14455 [Planctomycetales bacterium ZRK34]|nr:hypothetical protein HED60_14455 [Planctomycetales bacterium ZRK34]